MKKACLSLKFKLVQSVNHVMGTLFWIRKRKKEICTEFTECLYSQYANWTSATEDVTCVDRSPCDGEEVRMSSRFADSFCLGSNVPDCVKLGVENEYVNVQAKKRFDQ